MSGTQEFQARRGREGNRWWNERPSGAEVASWFKENVIVHDGMRHEDYVSGITLITTTETTKTIVGYNADGSPRIVELDEICYTPYPRVDARVLYFWRWMAIHPGWVGAISPHTPEQADGSLPPGFFKMAVSKGDDTLLYVGRAMQAEVATRHYGDDYPVGQFPVEAKMVPLLDRYGNVDPDALAKASTGAIGRALGAAGVLVIPGSGVATAEDMLTPTAATAATPVVPRQPTTAEMRTSLSALIERLNGSDQRDSLREWWSQRSLPPFSELTESQVKLALKKAEDLADRATPTTIESSDALA